MCLLQCAGGQVIVGGHAIEAGQIMPGLQPQPQSGEADIGTISLEAGQLVRGQVRVNKLREAGDGGGLVVPSENKESCCIN